MWPLLMGGYVVLCGVGVKEGSYTLKGCLAEAPLSWSFGNKSKPLLGILFCLHPLVLLD